MQTIIESKDAPVIQPKVVELQSKIFDAQANALSAQDERATLVERVSELEKQVADLKAWGAEKENYELKDVYPGAFAYVLKPNMQGTEPPHWLCTTCYQNATKSFLQKTGKTIGVHNHVYRCFSCKSEITVDYQTTPSGVA